jgi:hypothetical protein
MGHQTSSRQVPRADGHGVAAWRQNRLLAAGFDCRVAFDFARHEAVDLHELLDLVDRGCPPHLAARIVAPLEYEAEPR